MKITESIERTRDAVVQIATPFTTGTGFYLAGYPFIVTSEHVVRDNIEVIVQGKKISRQLAKVVHLDQYRDLALLAFPLNKREGGIQIRKDQVNLGDGVVALGHPFGADFSATQGSISSLNFKIQGLNFTQHSAELNPGYSGGPLIDTSGHLVGINSYMITSGGPMGLALSYKSLKHILEEIEKRGLDKALSEGCSSCSSCESIIFTTDQKRKGYCPQCGSKIILPSDAEAYEPTGVQLAIEKLVKQLGYNVPLSRKGPDQWEIKKGSARININYHENTGLIVADAHLCKLPQAETKKVYQYILRQNYDLRGLTFSTRRDEIVLSLLIHDQYFDANTGLELLDRIFQTADDYDDILIDEFGAESLDHWKG